VILLDAILNNRLQSHVMLSNGLLIAKPNWGFPFIISKHKIWC